PISAIVLDLKSGWHQQVITMTSQAPRYVAGMDPQFQTTDPPETDTPGDALPSGTFEMIGTTWPVTPAGIGCDPFDVPVLNDMTKRPSRLLLSNSSVPSAL